MRRWLLLLVLALVSSAEPSCAENDLRIARPKAATTEVSKPVTDAGPAELRRSRPVENQREETVIRGNHYSSFCTTGGAMPICGTTESSSSSQSSIEDPTKRLNHICCDVTSEYFPITIVGPSQHFGMWLRLNLYPTLCSSVLCQRQCAINGYESCNALGVERNLIQSVIDSTGGDCSSGGCCEADRTNTTFVKDNKVLSMQP